MSAEKGRSLAVNKRKILESAQKHLQRGALDKALEDYQTLVKADPKDSNIRLKVGDLHLKLGRTQDAIDAYLRVAQQFTNEGFDAKAVALYKQITKLDEKRFEVNAQLGELYQRMGLTSEAMKAMQLAADGAHRAGDKGQALSLLRRMAALDPTNTASRLKVADLLRAEGKPEEALAEYDEVVRELARQNNGEEQIKVLERALELAPTRLETLRALARAAIEVGVSAKAEKAARSLLAAAPDDLEGLELAGTALERAGRADEAADVFRKLAEKFRARGEEDRARALMQRYGTREGSFDGGASEPPVLESDPADLEIDPDLDASLGLPAEGELELNDETSAVATQPAPSVAAEDESADFELDDSGAAGRAESAAAEPAADESQFDVDPDADVDQLLAEASVFMRYGKHERAIDTLRAALRVAPGSAPALEKLGEALTSMGNRQHASSALARAGAAYADAGDAEGVERVRSLLRPLDAKAAGALAAAPPKPAPEPASDQGDVEIDAGVDEPMTEPPAREPASEGVASGDDFSGIEIDVSSDFADEERDGPPESTETVPTDDEAEFSFESNDAETPAASAPQPEAEAQPPPLEGPASGADAERAQADFEEAEFYREQGLREEARALYERVLAALPGHADAARRLREVQAERKPATAPPRATPAVAKPAAAPAAAPAPSAEVELDLGDDAPDAHAPAPVRRTSSEETVPDLPEAATIPAAPARPSEAVPTPAPAPATRPLHGAEPAAPAPIALGGADFDLAAELSGALAEDAGAPSASRARDGDGFEEVFAAFKAGVKREMGEGDFEAHYDLGIAYKEMGLHEDAIGELRLALGAPARRLGCLHLMAACALELGRGSDAVSHLSEALAGGALPAEQEAALRIDLGRAHLACGDRRRARAEYETVKRLAPGFGDVDRLIAEADAAPLIPRAGGEAFESFDDLLEEDARAAAEPPPDSRYETFDELISEDSPAEPALAPERQADALAEAEEPNGEIASEDEVEPPPAAPPAPPAAPARSRKAAITPPEPAAPATPPSAGAPAAGPARRKRKISFV